MENTNISAKSKQISTRNLVLTGMFTAMLCVMAQIEIPTQPIPFTLALFAIFLIGALLPPRYAFLSVLAYILLGAFGVPVFAGLKGGFNIITGVTGGFIIAYPLMALITALSGKLFKKSKVLLTISLTMGMVIALFVCYMFGSLWFTVSTGSSFNKALTLCVFPFILFDLIKIVLAVSLSMVIRSTVFKFNN